jgi:radical SAM superfamily enzyme YgiQ (UPF0313 family)
MAGEGERTFKALMDCYGGCMEKENMEAAPEELKSIPGLIYRDKEGIIHTNPPAKLMDLDEIPFVYEQMEDFEHKIIYYESSRGCPFSCSYCLSSIDKRVRFRSLEKVLPELQFFLDAKVPQVKFVDRTFNCRHSHSKAIWRYLAEHDNGVTNFHFEIAADLLDEEELTILSGLRPGQVQLEIGVQSVNGQTISEIDRVMDLDVLRDRVARIHDGKNIHQHLDLIAGLPYEGKESFIHSFNEVYAMKPQQLQLGFLKVLRGSKMHEKAEDYGILYRQEPPYEVLSTKWISYGELQQLKKVEEMVEVYYNSNQFANTIARLEQTFLKPYDLFAALAAYYEEHGLFGRNHSRMGRLEILRDFAREHQPELGEAYDEGLLLDLYLRENSKSRPSWGRDLSPYKDDFREFFQREAEEGKVLKGYDGYTWKQIMNMTHSEVFVSQGNRMVVFDYRNRDPLTGNASIYEIPKRDGREESDGIYRT